MSVEALGGALHLAGVDVDRTTLGVAIRHLTSMGYAIVDTKGERTFHTQPEKGDKRTLRGEGGVGGDGKAVKLAPGERSGRV